MNGGEDTLEKDEVGQNENEGQHKEAAERAACEKC